MLTLQCSVVGGGEIKIEWNLEKKCERMLKRLSNFMWIIYILYIFLLNRRIVCCLRKLYDVLWFISYTHTIHKFHLNLFLTLTHYTLFCCYHIGHTLPQTSCVRKIQTKTSWLSINYSNMFNFLTACLVVFCLFFFVFFKPSYKFPLTNSSEIQVWICHAKHSLCCMSRTRMSWIF